MADNCDVRIHVEADAPAVAPAAAPPPPRVANGAPAQQNTLPPPGERESKGRARANRLLRWLGGGLRRRCDYQKIEGEEPSGDLLPPEWWKTGVAFLYALFNLLFTTVVITVVHERVPDKTLSPPLPDKFFDYVERVGWAFTVTEVNGLALTAMWLLQWLLLQHRSIVGRRCFFLIGTLYMYRCVTMYITTLPVPGRHMVCAPKLYNDSTGKIWRILRLISGGGLSLTGSHLMCGDFLYSGHTVMCTLSYLFIKEYSPPGLWWYRWFCFLLSSSGVVCILVAHEHYSIDVVIGYFVTTRTFWWYHTLANTPALRGAQSNFLSRTWWNPIFNFLERNVQTSVPLTYTWPLAPPTSCRRKYRNMEAGREE